jgi:acetyl esterase/lipase
VKAAAGHESTTIEPQPAHGSSEPPSTARVLLDLLARPERHRYGDHRCNRAELYLPQGSGPHPVAVAIHGGSWEARYGRRLMKAVAVDLARRGHAVWNVEYRRLGRGQGGGWPATFHDVGLAIDHLAELHDPRLDLGSVVGVGHSAGGQLALWAAAREEPRVRLHRVVAQAAVCDLVAARDPASRLLGGTPEEVPERYAEADPMQRLPLQVPVLLVHGTHDETVPVRRSRRYAQAAVAAGGDVELVETPSDGHRVHIDPRSDAWLAAARWIEGAAAGGVPPTKEAASPRAARP